MIFWGIFHVVLNISLTCYIIPCLAYNLTFAKEFRLKPGDALMMNLSPPLDHNHPNLNNEAD
jgi:hypothetical protein